MNRIMKKIMPLMLLFLFIFSSVVYASTTPCVLRSDKTTDTTK